MPILISDARTRIALQLGLAVIAAEEAVVAKETLGEILERTYKALAEHKEAEKFGKQLPEFERWRMSRK